MMSYSYGVYQGVLAYMSAKEQLVTIRTYDHPWEASIERSVLESEGIATFLSDQETAYANWFYTNAVGGVKLRVPESRREEALRILSEQDDGRAHLEEQYHEKRACPECGSFNLHLVQRGRRWFYLSILFLGFPLFWPRQRYQCEDCGAVWKDEEES